MARAVLFDVYGTLLDVGSVAAEAKQQFGEQGHPLSTLWREKQLQYSWLRTLSGRYADFWSVTGDALDFAVENLGLEMDAAARERLMQSYKTLSPFADAVAALPLLAQHAPLAVLSNGTPEMLQSALTAAGLRRHFVALLSVDAVGAYKTSPAAYATAVERFGGTPDDFILVSSNGWDVAGAAHFGFRTFWVNRRGAPVERLGVAPSATGTSLSELVRWLGQAM